MEEKAVGGCHLDSTQWDLDCDAAFELALPPRWEFRDRAWGAPSSWRAFPEPVNMEINSIVRRGQRRSNITLGGCELVVDLQDMVAVPTDQYAAPRMLRKCARQPHVNKRALKQLYSKYCDELPTQDGSGCTDGILGDKFLQLFKDIVVDPAADVTALAFASACNAAEMGVFRRKEFICGCTALEVDTLEDLRDKMPELRANVLNGTTLPEVYMYTFSIALEPPSKVLPLEEAQQYWALLLHDWPLREPFCDWASRQMKGKAINRDLWTMVLKLATEVPADLSTYDENPAWPVIFDEFVEYYRGQKGEGE
jgi:DCN1-like protein 1/2